MDFNANQYVFFILDKSLKNNASFSFNAEYIDKQGNTQRRTLPMIDKNTGDKMVKRYRVLKGHGSLRVNKAQSEEIEFLRNHPRCAGSPNGDYRPDGKGGQVQLGVWFSELNTEKIAQEGVDAKLEGIKAANVVMEISEDAEQLSRLAAIFGYRGSHSEMLFKLIEHAQKYPNEVNEEIESPDFVNKSLFRKAINKKVVIQKGITYTVEDYELGIDEESCLKTMANDKDVVNLIEKKLSNS